ncbi:BRO family protein [Streptomyces sp. NPDC020898]|uniref:BRO-N domain-containing protein n=1 Tax=Streptomyces sp. NPDC020898 TaxID=3365101 RepID=UPI0037A8C517
MSEHDTTSSTAPQTDAIDINDFVYGATGARVRRLTMPDGSHWFPAADVLGELGYTNPRKTLKDHVPDEFRTQLESVTTRYGSDVPAGHGFKKSMNMVNLNGLIMLIAATTKPETRPFKRWVAEVIITVQRDGSYALPKAEVQPRDPSAPVSYAMPAQVADAIVRLEEHNARLDEEFAEAQRMSQETRHEAQRTRLEAQQTRLEMLDLQRTSAQTQSRMADAMDRIADALETFRPVRAVPSAAPADTYRTSAEALLADWRSRMSVTEDVWAVAVTIAPVLAEHGEIRMSLESLAARTGLNTHRVNECLRFMRRHACIRSLGGTEEGALVYVPARP